MGNRIYNPLNNAGLSTTAAAVPAGVIAGSRLKAPVAAIVGLWVCDALNATQHDRPIVASSDPATVANRIC
jgi:hypothetical protein